MAKKVNEEEVEVIQEDLYQVASQKENNTVVAYIEKTFQESQATEQYVRNIHKLSDFLKNNSIVIAEIGAEKILQKSEKLNQTLKKLYMADSLLKAYHYANIIPFIEVYCATNGVDLSKDSDEAIYGKVDKDIDLIKLYLSEIVQYKQLTAEEEKELAHELINSEKLTEKERDILKHRLGFYGNTKTLEEIGQQYGLSRERIRQIERVALKKLLKAYHSKKFYQYRKRLSR